MKRIADTGLLVAALDRRDEHFDWACNVLLSEPPPWLVCEPVLAEAAALIETAEPLLRLLERGDLQIDFALDESLPEVHALIKKYRDQPMDLADACVVRMAEIHRDCCVWTVDTDDFRVYRRFGRQIVPFLSPSKS